MKHTRFLSLFLALCLKLVKVEQVKSAGSFLTSILPVLFVSPSVGILENWDLIKVSLFAMLLLALATTCLTFGIAGRVAQAVMQKGGKDCD